MLQGLITALVTPFTKEGSVDEKAFCSFVEWQISEGVSGLVPTGTTGESLSLSRSERLRIMELCVQVSAGRLPVMAGVGTSNTQETISLSLDAKKAGVDALLVVTPYYNRPTQRGLYEHYKSVADATHLPIIVYNIPFRSGIDLLPETLGSLVKECPNIVGIKDSSGKLERVLDHRITCGKDFIQLSGDDVSAAAFNAQGGLGCISVTSNVAPRLCADLQKATLSNTYSREHSLLLQESLFPLHQAIFLESGASGVKFALSSLGVMHNVLRSPLTTVHSVTEKAIDSAMRLIGVTY